MTEEPRKDGPRLADVLADVPPAAQEAPPGIEAPPAPEAPKAKDAPLPPSSGDRVQRLERLAKLHQRGALTDEEFERAKAKVLRGR